MFGDRSRRADHRYGCLPQSSVYNDRMSDKAAARKAATARAAAVLEAIPNIGPSVARDLRSIGIKRPQDLIGRNPQSLYERLCRRTGARQDPCVLDTFVSAVRFMEGAPPRPWWHYTPQ